MEKTAVNHPKGKNIIGAFHQPQCVLSDLEVLKTLPAKEMSAGYAEVIKYGMIADQLFFEWLFENRKQLLVYNKHNLANMIKNSCAIKAQVVTEDETEQGRRAILNFGHTFGHAIEAYEKYSGFLHGEAGGNWYEYCAAFISP